MVVAIDSFAGSHMSGYFSSIVILEVREGY